MIMKITLKELIAVLIILFVTTFASYSYWKNDIPVISEMKTIEPLTYNDGVWTTSIHGKKNRNCTYIQSENKGFAYIHDKWIEVSFYYTNDDTPGSNRPIGYQIFDTWNWIATKDTKALKLIVKHLCENDQIVSTTIGPFKTYNN